MLAAAFGAALLAGCGKAPTEELPAAADEEQEAILPEEEKLEHSYTSVEGLSAEPGTYVAVVVKGLGENSYWDMIRQGVEAAVADVNTALGYQGDREVRVTFEGPSEENNEEEQINTLDTVLSENPDALCLAAVDQSSCEAQLETAADNGIPVLILDAGIKSDLVTAVCQTDNVKAGKAAADHLCEGIGEKGKVALVGHQPETETYISRSEGFRKELEKYPEVELVCELVEDPEVTMEEQLLAMKEEYPDLAGIVCTNESNSNAVLKVYEKDETLPVLIGFDNGEAQIQAILDGREYGCISQNPYSMGYAAVIAALHADNDEDVDPVIDSGYVWIDSSNIENPENQIYLYR